MYTSKQEAIEQLVKVLPRTITSISEAPEYGGLIFFIKIYIKDGFWRMLCQAGGEWNLRMFCKGGPRKKNTGGENITADGVDTITNLFLHNYRNRKGCLSVCRSGILVPIAYSLLGGGVPIPEQRLYWTLDSVP